MVSAKRQIVTQGVHHQGLRELGTSLQPHARDTETLQLVTWKAKRVRQNTSPGAKIGLLKSFFERENAWPGVFPFKE